MLVFSGYERFKLIALAVFYFQANQSVECGEGLITHQLLPSKENIYAPIDAIISEKPSFTERNIELYSSTVRAFRKPTPGTYKDQLDLAMGKSKKEKGNYSGEVSVDPYWPTVKVKLMWEDVNNIKKALQDLKIIIKNRGSEDAIKDERGVLLKSTGHSNFILNKHANGLDLILESLKHNMVHKFENWAKENHFTDPKIFAGGKIHQELETSSDTIFQTDKTIMGPENSVKYFPKYELTELLEQMEFQFNLPKYNNDKEVLMLRRIHIQTLDQLYKFGLISDRELKNIATSWLHPNFIPTTQKMFKEIYGLRKEHENSILQNIYFTLKKSHQSPLLNALELLDINSQTRVLGRFLQSDLMKYKAENDGPFGHTVKQLANRLYGYNQLNTALEKSEKNGDLDEAIKIPLVDVIQLFTDDHIWKNKWETNEGIRILAQIIEVVIQHGQKNEHNNKIISSVDGIFDDSVSSRLELLSSRHQALLELEDIRLYLEKDFPLSKKIGSERIPPLVELNLIESHIKSSPSQLLYRKNISYSQGVDQTSCTQEVEAKLHFLESEINRLRKRYSKNSV
ncbi:hypothetical protein PGT21_013429 [Puccinia graminis f. sp. tritici]|uniref:Uncharacterized protein n=1 Tax=Puccinia graminis f. sp. tritici TaxID=56615 RepID=A0A5B0LSS6_PUCGR|nr:hypothetical protein PGTUg99_020605 [Puccinia graminis f. sp. tritici]KAA1071633.1 hypothetical protein PGT21_013429 [Puccinia graminis f. sp. tritici]